MYFPSHKVDVFCIQARNIRYRYISYIIYTTTRSVLHTYGLAHIYRPFFISCLSHTHITHLQIHTYAAARTATVPSAHEALCWLADWSLARSLLYSHAVHTHTHSTPQFTYSIRFCLIYVRTCLFRMYFFMWHKQEYDGGNDQCISGYFSY